MAFLNDYQYYENNGNPPQNENWGSYQYMSLEDIVNTFMKDIMFCFMLREQFKN